MVAPDDTPLPPPRVLYSIHTPHGASNLRSIIIQVLMTSTLQRKAGEKVVSARRRLCLKCAPIAYGPGKYIVYFRLPHVTITY